MNEFEVSFNAPCITVTPLSLAMKSSSVIRNIEPLVTEGRAWPSHRRWQRHHGDGFASTTPSSRAHLIPTDLVPSSPSGLRFEGTEREKKFKYVRCRWRRDTRRLADSRKSFLRLTHRASNWRIEPGSKSKRPRRDLGYAQTYYILLLARERGTLRLGCCELALVRAVGEPLVVAGQLGEARSRGGQMALLELRDGNILTDVPSLHEKTARM